LSLSALRSYNYKVLTHKEHITYWTNAQFRNATADPAHSANFAALLEYSEDKDGYIYPVPLPKTSSIATAAGAGAGPSGAAAGPSEAYRSFAHEVNDTLASLRSWPSLRSLLQTHKLQPLDLSSTLTLSNERLSLQFDNTTGAIVSLVERTGASPGRQWASPDKPLGKFAYRTYTQKYDIDRYIAQLGKCSTQRQRLSSALHDTVEDFGLLSY
jgi:hypothetical protein